ncbi:Remorin family protein [Rhynchospora pubera]|uniref:Remorin family protein n=1 Tax=Rhynchospora pubera TaxID=906938 RepID=A0AAV8CFJ3_9POAL|nr:Remorin family protein [Rhynchospora pubera]
MPDLEPASSLHSDVPKTRTNKLRSAKTKRKQREKKSLPPPPLVKSLAESDCSLSGPDLDPQKRNELYSFPLPADTLTPQSHLNLRTGTAVNGVLELEEKGDPPKHSFSNALKECQNLRLRSEAAPGEGPSASNQLHRHVYQESQCADIVVLSPRFTPGGMSKSNASSRSRSGTFPSPGTPNYTRHGLTSGTYQKGWSSERVPLSNRRYGSSSVVLPFNNGRKLPSKWEDAEKWILSPVGDGTGRQSAPPPHHRRPKSKSGPLGPTNIYAASPVSRGESFVASSPFLAGVLIPEHGVHDGSLTSDNAGNLCSNKEPFILRSVSVSGWMDTLMEATAALPPSRDTKPEEKVQITREAMQRITAGILTKDVATQMSPEGSVASSPRELSFSYSPSHGPIEEVTSSSTRLEVRDVEVDNQVTVTRWSKKNVIRSFDKRSVGSWEDREKARCTSKSKREEAKITAWENLQKAKAEAAIRKLEMKLEKKRSSSMDKIISRLRTAQKKAQDMREAVVFNQDQSVGRSEEKAFQFCRTSKLRSLSGCFTCHGIK